MGVQSSAAASPVAPPSVTLPPSTPPASLEPAPPPAPVPGVAVPSPAGPGFELLLHAAPAPTNEEATMAARRRRGCLIGYGLFRKTSRWVLSTKMESASPTAEY